MPMYDYTCICCSNTKELMSLVDKRDNPRDCNLCNTEGAMRRVTGEGNNGGFRLLGSGWERDNYATYLGDV